jgi:hypothetical protein
MTERERMALAEQLMANPLFDALFAEQEAQAVERLIYAPDHETRHEAALRAQAIRTLRQDCVASLRNTQPRKDAPA